uniref:Cytochrome P450 89A2-like n=1 Tax=Rhizophora mucronata TaxID=61149 RepID=A0A2P2LAK2_RHIMU
METEFIALISILSCVLLAPIFKVLVQPTRNREPTNKHKLPPGPPTIPIFSSLLWLPKSFAEIELVLKNLRSKYGPIITLYIRSRPAIFIASHSLAHKALIQNGAVFADRPPTLPTNKLSSCDNLKINSAFYGPTWRLLRRNLTSEILHHSRIKSYSPARKWVLEILINRLKSHSQSSDHRHVIVKDHFQYAMFCLLVLVCFGDKLDEEKIREVEEVQRHRLLTFDRHNILNFWPGLTKILFHRRWKELFRLHENQEKVLAPLIRARQNAKHEKHMSKAKEEDDFTVCYVDTLLDLEIPDGDDKKRKLQLGEIIALCSEFLDGGTDTTSTALQWVMANLVKYPHIQEKLFTEINVVMVAEEEEVKEDELQKMPYLKAIILEGLRRHPPGHFVLPHAVTQDTILEGFLIPKNGVVNFTVAEMGLDPKVWEDPMEFKPERFLHNNNGKDEVEAFDLTGNREIKMMPFGAGRRMCPGYHLAMLHLEYYVANLVWNFKWTAADGDDIDLSEKQEFTTVMKHPLEAIISPRKNA